jgi:hypothetical protein
MIRLFLSLFLLFSFVAEGQHTRSLLTNAPFTVPTPTVQATNITFSNVSDVSMTISWTNGNGFARLVIVKAGSAVNSFPTSNTTYTANTVFGSGTQLGTGNYVVYNGSGTSVDITGLTANTTYHVIVTAYNGNPGKEKYNIDTATGNPANQTTDAVISAPTVQATNIVWDGLDYVHLTRGNGDFILVVAREGGAVNANPSDNTTYTASSTYGSGTQIGTGNYVIYKGTANNFRLAYRSFDATTTYGVRAYEFNGGAGSEKYKTDTDTGNPLSHLTPTPTPRFLHHDAVTRSDRSTAHPEDVSRYASKTYTGSVWEAGDYRCQLVIGDNNSGPSTPYHYDQVYLRYQDITDDPRDPLSWEWFDSGDAGTEPDTILGSKAGVGTKWYRGQQWAGTPIVTDETDIRFYYSAGISIVSRYSAGYATMDISGLPTTVTVTRNEDETLPEDGNNNYYQFQQAYKDTDLTKIIIKSPNRNGSATDGRYSTTDILVSNDGFTGDDFTRTSTNIYAGLDIDVGGISFEGPMFKEGGVWKWYVGTDELPNYHSRSDDLVRTVYVFLNKSILKVASPNITSATPTVYIEEVIFEGDQSAYASMFPASAPISFGGEEHIFCSTYTWQAIEDGPGQLPIDIRVLSTAAFSGTQVVGNNAHPYYVDRYYKPHQTHLDDTHGGTVQPREVITETDGTVVGSPTQDCLNKMVPSSADYVTFPSFTQDTKYLSVSCVATRASSGGNDLAICEKEGVFKIFIKANARLEVWLYGQGGGIKKYRSTNTISSYQTGLFFPYYTKVGFVARYNGSTDIDLQLNIDYSTNVTLTTVAASTFTDIVTNSNVFRIGQNTDLANSVPVVGAATIMWGTTHATQFNWINNNY